jgi:hypothetical protein
MDSEGQAGAIQANIPSIPVFPLHPRLNQSLHAAGALVMG